MKRIAVIGLATILLVGAIGRSSISQTIPAPLTWTFVSSEYPLPINIDYPDPTIVQTFQIAPGQTLRFGTHSCPLFPSQTEMWNYMTNSTNQPIVFPLPFNAVFGDPAVGCTKELDSMDPVIWLPDPPAMPTPSANDPGTVTPIAPAATPSSPVSAPSSAA